jgi:hypothetical protein
VGCAKGMGNWYGLEKQIAMGKQISQQVESQSKVINDPVISEYINRLGQNLVRNSDSQVPFTIKVIDSDDINAFALPGGFFYVNSGLILAADEEAELAGVMAHEIGHVAACHAAREQTRGTLMQMMTIPLIFMGGPIGYAAYEGAGLAVPLTFLKFSRGFEAQEYVVTGSEFDEVKARLAVIENKHKIIEDKDSKKPSLRRASPTDKNGSDDKTTNDDGRPTLKRRPDDSQ